MNSIAQYLNTTKGVTFTVTLMLILMCCYIVVFTLGIKPKNLAINTMKFIGKFLGKGINNFETKYHRDMEIGKINEKSMRSKTYRFMNNLIIDLGLKKKGVTPFEFTFFVLSGSLVIALIFGFVLLGNAAMSLASFPLWFGGITCGLYTKANLAHDTRIDAVIDAENIISNNIEKGVIVAVRTNINGIPNTVRPEFKDFLDNIEHRGYHIKTALLELNDNLGSVSDDFIQKCITIEIEEEQGLAGIFKDVVELNNIKSELRTDMKRQFEEVITEFVVGTGMIYGFLMLAIGIYPVLQQFYFHTMVGQMLLLLDLGILVIEFMYITYLRAQEI